MKDFLLLTAATLLASAASGQPGSLDSTFDSNGIVTIDFGKAHDVARAAVLQPDGKIVSVGGTTGTNEKFLITRHMQDGSLDDSFGTAGVVTGVFGLNSGARCVALQSDNKIVVGGYTGDVATSGVVIARYNTDGSLDNSFAGNGYTTISIGVNNEVRGIAVQPDGRIVVCGRTVIVTPDTASAWFFVGRLTDDGQLDPSFDNDGIILTRFNDSADEHANAVVLQPDGKIVAIGFIRYGLFSGETAVARYNQDGSLDGSFANAGKLSFMVGNMCQGYAGILQPDGRIVISGSAGQFPSTFFDHMTVRLKPDGSFDSTFGTNGLVLHDMAWSEDIAHAAGLQPDGKIVIAGGSINVLGEYSSLARYDSNGAVDSSFNAIGKVVAEVGEAENRAYALLMQPDEKLVAVGFAHNGSDRDFALVRYQPNGNLDSSFGTDGLALTGFVSDDQAHAVVIQPNERVVAAGTAGFNVALARVDRLGSLDPGFGIGSGKLTTPTFGRSAAHSVIMTPDAHLVIAGEASTQTIKAFTLARYSIAGHLDFSFGSSGIVTTNIGLSAAAYSVALQSDGKIIAAGFANSGTDDDFVLVRYHHNGSTDNGFGSAGKVMTTISPGNDGAHALGIQPDGKIVAAGYARGGFAVARYNPNGTLDNTFAGDGKIITSVGGNDTSYAMALQPNGKIIVVGSTDDRFGVVRYMSTGALDNSFGTGGIVTTSLGVKSGAHAVTLQPDGKIVVAGFANNGVDDDFAVVRYDADGSLDTTFSATGFVVTPVGQYNDVARAVAITPDGKIVAAGYSHNGTDDDFAIVRYISGLDLGVVEFVEQPDPSSQSVLVYPNPIRDRAILEYTLSQDEVISIHLFDLQGRIMTTFIEEEYQPAGHRQQVISLGDDLPSSTYVIVISSPSGAMSLRVVK